MINRDFIGRIMRVKQERGWTLHDLSKELDIQISTIERWFKTGRINKVYARMVEERLKIR